MNTRDLTFIWLCSAYGSLTTLVTGYDGIAVETMRFLHEVNISFPKDISIISYEDDVLTLLIKNLSVNKK